VILKTVSLKFSSYLRYIAENLRSKILTAVSLRTYVFWDDTLH